MRALLGPRARLLVSGILGLVLIVMLFPFYVIGRGSMEVVDPDHVAHLSWQNWHVRCFRRCRLHASC